MQINLTPDVSLLVIMGIFLLNYLVVSRFFLRPINRVMEEREEEARLAAEVYETSLARFREATARMEEQLHVAKREAAALRERLRAEAAAHRAAVLTRTGADAKRIVTEADERLSREVRRAREIIVREADALARLAAERILGRAV
jgi:F-type H+-transporting ATPase subunit b